MLYTFALFFLLLVLVWFTTTFGSLIKIYSKTFDFFFSCFYIICTRKRLNIIEDTLFINIDQTACTYIDFNRVLGAINDLPTSSLLHYAACSFSNVSLFFSSFFFHQKNNFHFGRKNIANALGVSKRKILLTRRKMCYEQPTFYWFLRNTLTCAVPVGGANSLHMNRINTLEQV